MIGITNSNTSTIYVGPTEPTSGVRIWLDTDEDGASAVNSVNGHNGTVVLDADDVGATTPWVKKWVNANGSSSSFSAQTIQIDLSQYQEVRIQYEVYQTGSDCQVCVDFTVPSSQFVTYFGVNDSGANYGFRRSMKVTTSGVVFGKAVEKTASSTGNSTEKTDRMIPLAIYAR